jgi:hypothetical protein
MGDDFKWEKTPVLPQIICTCGFMVQGVDEAVNADVFKTHVGGGPGCPGLPAQTSDAAD